jgi:hypothetical protein
MSTKHLGGCHCGAVRFAVDLDLEKGASRCNCSICHKVSNAGMLIKPEAFQLLEGEQFLSSYSFGAKIGVRRFCRHCGVHCYGQGHLEMLGGDFVTVNLNVVDDVDSSYMPTQYWDGRHDNWQAGPRPQAWPLWA